MQEKQHTLNKNAAYRDRISSIALTGLFFFSAAATTMFSALNGLDQTFQGMALVFMVVFLLQVLRSVPVNMVSLIGRTWVYQIYMLISVYTVIIFHPQTIGLNFWAYFIIGFVLLVPTSYVISQRDYLLDSFLRVVFGMGVVLAVPVLFGAMAVDSFFGLPMNNKEGYAHLSGIIASSGIYDFPGTMGPQFAMSLVAGLWLRSRNPRGSSLFFVGIMLIMMGLIVTQARGAFLGLAIAWGLWVAARRFKIRGIAIAVMAVFGVLLPLFALDLLAMIPGVNQFLRVERGLAGREGGWVFALQQIAQNPWTGYGFNATSALTELYAAQLREMNFRAAGASVHNTYLTIAINYGLPAAISLLAIYMVALLRAARYAHISAEARFVIALIVVTMASGFYKDINIGGLRSISVIGTILLGYGLVADFRPSAVFRPHDRGVR